MVEQLEAAPQGISTEGTQEVKKARTLQRLNPPEGGWTEFPKEYDPSKHAPPRKKEFANPITWHEWKIAVNEEENRKHRESIAMYQKFGTDEASLKKVKQFNKSISVIKELASSLPEGINLQDILGDLAGLLKPEQ